MNKKILWTGLLLILIFSEFSMATESGKTCPAPMVDVFISSLKDSGASFGAYAQFDYLQTESCLEALNSCEKHIFTDDGFPGYYDPHSIFYVTYGDRVVFASTSSYYESTYGQQFGSATAEDDANTALESCFMPLTIFAP